MQQRSGMRADVLQDGHSHLSLPQRHLQHFILGGAATDAGSEQLDQGRVETCRAGPK